MALSPEATCYDDAFFEGIVRGSLRSARAVVPIVLELVRVESVADLGCGWGAWLKVFDEHGIEDLCGIDGDYVDRSKMLIDRAKFRSADLRKPISLGRRFDLALCLEVGEHMPRRSSKILVASLAAAAPVILFSAAIPGQGGVSHMNEQWPEYWERLFADRGYERLDLIRPRIWQDRDIECYFRQNLYLFATGPILAELRRIEFTSFGRDNELEILMDSVVGRYKSCWYLLGETFRAGIRALRNRIGY
jgi:hypothetical protein